MSVFISGTDTDVGKTTVSSWLALHTGFAYFKPIQTGSEIDAHEVHKLARCKVYPEIYRYPLPLSPHLAAELSGDEIDLHRIVAPQGANLIVEGAGGMLVPVTKNALMIDVIKKLALPVIVVARTTLGTINHTLLTLEALRVRKMAVLGVIMNGEPNPHNKRAIESYGDVAVLAEFPKLDEMNYDALKQVPLPEKLQLLLGQR